MANKSESSRLAGLLSSPALAAAIIAVWGGSSFADEGRASAKMASEATTEANAKAEWPRPVEVLRAELERRPDDAVLHNELGSAYADHHQSEMARAEWERAVELNPDYADAINSLGVHWTHHGAPMKAVDAFRRVVEIAPDNGTYRFNLSTAYYLYRLQVVARDHWSLSKIFRECQAHLSEALKIDPGNVEYAATRAANFLVADSFNVENTDDEAIQAWNRCLEMDATPKQKVNFLANIACIEIHRGRLESAREALVKAKLLGGGPRVDHLWSRANPGITSKKSERP